MAVWKLTLAYDGGGLHGWQVQPGLATVQGLLAEALARLTGEQVLPQGSGRTDAGVHALAQVASFRLVAAIPPTNLQRALNRALPAAIRVLRAEHAADDFHARHDALRKTYQYRVFAQDEVCAPMLAPYVWDCPWRLDLGRLQTVAAGVVGEHDFTSFAASDPEKRVAEKSGSDIDTVRRIERSCWQMEAGLLVYRVTGSGFLHHMVRNLVGTFVEMARGAMAADAIPKILAARNRACAGPTAPARGLFLESVEYGVAG